MNHAPHPSSVHDQAAASSRPATALGGNALAKWTWVPIRTLGPHHRPRILEHLRALDERSRYLRFGYIATDDQLARYVDAIDFDRDEVFGIFNRRLDLIATAHLAHDLGSKDAARPGMSEFGVSVLPHVRRRGLGRLLFEHAMLHARNRDVEKLFIHALSENTAMLKIARDAGATVERDGTESHAWLRLPPDTFASHLGEMIGEQAGEFDYRLKLHAHQLNSWVAPHRHDEPAEPHDPPAA
ncbi:GNAT family N-acetyltransferase [Piscinibacter koreensis]|uniref:GNAT family N-acetyltransferase n=1 Tax=Piscinibacter koreensis TaxID=2742824 RepID=A0A7Y6TW33_9BURK|nr:GNAT family N-acetyltransferase [Schlegelella koreensis]NUZ05586.1 GNAT family N-acetyltransferase [Schlegelella koreensis]